MPTKPTQLRIPPETLERIDLFAKERGMTRTALILEAVNAHLAPALEFSVPVKPDSEAHRLLVNAREADQAIERQIVAHAQPKPFRCPTHGCEYGAASAAARCPHHARLVVPI